MSSLFGDDAEYRHSISESGRFGLSVGRIDVPFSASADTSLTRVRELIAGAAAAEDVIVLRYPSAWVRWPAELHSCGRDLIHADALIHFELGLEAPLPGRTAPSGLRVLEADDLDVGKLEELVPEIFRDHTNHYLANPLFDPSAVIAGYQEWVRLSLARDRAVVLLDAGEPAGFLTFSAEGPRAELSLGGVLPKARRRGAFTALMVEAGRSAATAGCRSVGGPTHVQNVGTQRAFTAAGYRPAHAFNTMHAVRAGLLGARLGL